MRAWVMIGAALLTAACGPKTETTTTTDNTMVTDMNAVAEDDSAAETATGPGDPWQVQDAVDPITDAQLIRASIRVLGQVNDVEITAACNPGEPSINYYVIGFDKKGEGARLDTDFMGGSPVNSAIYRPDTRPAQTATTFNPQYNNQTQIGSEQGFDAANASRLTLRLQFSNANETYVVDQSSAGFQEAMRRCLEARAANARLEQRRAAAAAREEQERAAAEQTSAPEDPTPDTAAGNAY